MVLGALWCDITKSKEIAKRIREIKQEFNLPADFEIKWTKVSPQKRDFYLRLIDYFFDDDDLHFRTLVAHKEKLNHKDRNQTHDEWYYKTYYQLLIEILHPTDCYNIYLDIKDTLGGSKVRKLHDVLSNKNLDFSRSIIQKIQIVRSHEVDLLQLADLLIGAVSYINRGESGSETKLSLIQRIQERSGYDLRKSTLRSENKMNVFRWDPQEGCK